MENLQKFLEYRKKYFEFNFNSFEVVENANSIDIVYDFEIVGLSSFNPTWSFKKPEAFCGKKSFLDKIDKAFLDILVFNLGLVELVSYWKIACPKIVNIYPYNLTSEQANWWKKLYLNGLGEFLYTNGIYDYLKENNEELMQINCFGKSYAICQKECSELKGNLIPVGGGKDSVVTLELLKACKSENTCYVVNPRGATVETSNIAGYEEIYAPKRKLDSKMLELNSKGFLNGHTPFSAILAFSSYIAALILGKKYIILSNEASANEPNIIGTNINHQYSKSFEFEEDFRWYIQSFVSQNGPEYFSLLRPWSELQIVKYFVENEKYFKHFKSCNVGSKEDIWCTTCPKCLYVYIMLCAFDENIALEVFGKNLLEDINLQNIFDGLIYPDKTKPFECVGTKEEIDLALNMYIRRTAKQNPSFNLPLLLQNYSLMAEEKFRSLISKYENMYNENNNLNNYFESILKGEKSC